MQTGRSLGPDDLVVTGATLGNPPFETLVAAAVAGGFAGLSLWPGETYGRARAAGRSDAELRALLDDAGLVVNDVDALLVWVGEEPPRRALPGAREEDLFAAAEALGAGLLNVALVGRGALDRDRAAERFAGVCARAAERGLRAHLEFSPLSTVPDASTALAVVEAAGSGGLLLDTWHVFRGPTRPEDLARLPGERVLGVQLNDAPAEALPDAWQETMHHRLAPGEGDIDLVGFLRILDGIGSRAPLSVEVFSDALLARHEPEALARRLGDAVRAVRAEARAGRRAGAQASAAAGSTGSGVETRSSASTPQATARPAAKSSSADS